MNIVFLLIHFFVFANTAECYMSVLLRMMEHVHRIEPVHPPSLQETSNVRTEWIMQKVDNFNKSDVRKWNMRYFVNDEYFKPKGPIFIIVGGAYDISPYLITTGLIHDLAVKYNGSLFIIEHRYYGNSLPFKDLSVENLEYLNTEQTLADLAFFVKYIRKRYSNLKRSKIALMGGSYGGTIATWFRKKYPDLVQGAWASSAPILAKVEFKEYHESLGKAFLRIVINQSCYVTVSNVFKFLNHLLAHNPKIILKMFNVCNNFNPKNKLDVMTFNYLLSVFFSEVLEKGSIKIVKRICYGLKMKIFKSPFEVIYHLISTKFIKIGHCADLSFSTIIKDLSYENVFNNITGKYYALRQWFYESCSEFGWFETTSSKTQPFGAYISLEFFTTICSKLFGPGFGKSILNGSVSKINKYFGGLNLNVSNVIFTQGEFDPWRLLGIQEQNGRSTVISGYSRCKDIYSINKKEDTEEMVRFKERVQSKLKTWLGLCEFGDSCDDDDDCGDNCNNKCDEDCEAEFYKDCDNNYCKKLKLSLMYSLI